MFLLAQPLQRGQHGILRVLKLYTKSTDQRLAYNKCSHSLLVPIALITL